MKRTTTEVVVRIETSLNGPKYLKFPAQPEDYKNPAEFVVKEHASRFPDEDAAKQYLVNTGRSLRYHIIELAV